jgi:hypothetical protein
VEERAACNEDIRPRRSAAARVRHHCSRRLEFIISTCTLCICARTAFHFFTSNMFFAATAEEEEAAAAAPSLGSCACACECECALGALLLLVLADGAAAESSIGVE